MFIEYAVVLTCSITNKFLVAMRELHLPGKILSGRILLVIKCKFPNKTIYIVHTKTYSIFMPTHHLKDCRVRSVFFDFIQSELQDVHTVFFKPRWTLKHTLFLPSPFSFISRTTAHYPSTACR